MTQHVRSSAIRIVWGINEWVLVETPRGDVQRQVTSRKSLEALLVEIGVREEEVTELAASAWKGRPADAGFGASRESEAMWKGTGLTWWQAGALLVAVVVVGVVLEAFVLH